MATAKVDGLVDRLRGASARDVRGRLTPGGRFSKDYPGVRELAEALAAAGNQVLIWDRPNTGESDVCFTGRVRVGDAGRRAGRPAPPARPGPGRDRRRLRRLPGLAAHRVASPRRGRRAWPCGGSAAVRVGLITPRVPLLPGLDHGGLERRHGGGGRARRVAGGARAQPGATADRFLDLDPGRVPRHHGALDAGLLPLRRRARPRARRRRRRRAGRPGAGVPQRCVSDINHTRARPPRQLAAAAAERPAGRAALGRHRVDRPPGGTHRGEGGIFSGWHQLVPQLVEWSARVVPR